MRGVEAGELKKGSWASRGPRRCGVAETPALDRRTSGGAAGHGRSLSSAQARASRPTLRKAGRWRHSPRSFAVLRAAVSPSGVLAVIRRTRFPWGPGTDLVGATTAILPALPSRHRFSFGKATMCPVTRARAAIATGTGRIRLTSPICGAVSATPSSTMAGSIFSATAPTTWPVRPSRFPIGHATKIRPPRDKNCSPEAVNFCREFLARYTGNARSSTANACSGSIATRNVRYMFPSISYLSRKNPICT